MVCIVLAPLYGTSAVQDEYVGSFLRFTIVTLQPDDTVGLSAVLIASFSLAIGMFYFMKQEWRHFVEMRRTFMLHSAQGLGLLGPGESDEHRHSTTQAHYSILIENLPAGVSDTDETLYQMLQKLFKRIEKQFCIVQENTLLAHRLKALQEITPFTCSWCFEGTCGRAMQCLRKTIVEKEKKLHADVLTNLMAEEKSTTAFVTLRSARDRQVAERLKLFSARDPADGIDFEHFVIKPAPERKDIIWDNAALSYPFLQKRRRLGFYVFLVALVFWTFPIAVIMSYATILADEEQMPRFVGFLKRMEIYEFVAGYLPALSVIVILSFVPILLTRFSLWFEGHKDRSSMMRTVFGRNLVFRLATLYVTVFANNIAKTLALVFQRPKCLFEIAGKSVPGVSAYFTTFVIVRCATSLPLLMLKPVFYMLISKLCGSKPGPVLCDVAVEATDIVEVLVIAFTYSIISPLILPICMLYFALATFEYRWLFRNVYDQEKMVEFRGLLSIDLRDGAMVGMVLGNFALSGFLLIHLDLLGTRWGITLAVLIFLNVFHWNWWYAQNKKFKSLAVAMPWEDAFNVDHDKSEKGSYEVSKSFNKEYYRDPCASLSDNAEISSDSKLREGDANGDAVSAALREDEVMAECTDADIYIETQFQHGQVYLSDDNAAQHHDIQFSDEQQKTASNLQTPSVSQWESGTHPPPVYSPIQVPRLHSRSVGGQVLGRSNNEVIPVRRTTTEFWSCCDCLPLPLVTREATAPNTVKACTVGAPASELDSWAHGAVKERTGTIHLPTGLHIYEPSGLDDVCASTSNPSESSAHWDVE
jgi:hypothetical protein